MRQSIGKHGAGAFDSDRRRRSSADSPRTGGRTSAKKPTSNGYNSTTNDVRFTPAEGVNIPARRQQRASSTAQRPSAERPPARRNNSTRQHGAADLVHREKKHTSRYIPALDGLRAFAVLAVMAYHLGIHQMQSGLLGVTMFFVLSGYLITGLLIKEWDETDRIDLKHFWLRRVRRLFPAIVTCVVVVAALTSLFNHELLTKMRPDIPPALFFYTNWWYIFHNISYFDALGSPSPLTHFWSLAIEEQFYVVWPLLLLGLFKAGIDKKGIRRGCLVLAAVSAALMALLFNPDGDPSRVYYGTDTRAMSLLIGAWMAFSWPGHQFSEEHADEGAPGMVRILDIAGTVALIGIVVIMVTVSGFSSFLYYGGILLASVLTALVMAALVHPRSILAKIFQSAPLVWIGKRSYGMYLWHYPLILLLAPLVSRTQDYPWYFDVAIYALTMGIAALSYTFIENPIRKGAIGNLVRSVRAGEVQLTAYAMQHLAPIIVVLAVFGVAGVGYATVPDTSLVPEDAIVSTGAAANKGMDLSQREQEQVPSDSSVNDTAQSAAMPQPTTTNSAAAPSTTAVHEQGKSNPVFIGDSVPGAIENQFADNFPYGLIDTYVGRRLEQGISVYQDYETQGAVGHVVVFELFTNHLVSNAQIDSLITAVSSDKSIYLVNIYTPDDWEPQANQSLADAAKRYPNVHVIDWNAACTGHEDEYLYEDMTHLTPEGADAYAALVKQAVTPDLPAQDVSTSAAPL